MSFINIDHEYKILFIIQMKFIALKMNILSIKHNVNTNVFNDCTCSRQSVITLVVIRFFDRILSTE